MKKYSFFVKKIIASMLIIICAAGIITGCSAKSNTNVTQTDSLSAAESSSESQSTTNAPIVSETPAVEAVYDFSASSLKYVTSFVTEDSYSNGNYLVLTFEYTNKGEQNVTFASDITVKAKQIGEELIQPTSSYGIDGFDSNAATKELAPGETTTLQVAFEIKSFDETVKVELYDNADGSKPDYRFDMKPKAKK